MFRGLFSRSSFGQLLCPAPTPESSSDVIPAHGSSSPSSTIKWSLDAAPDETTADGSSGKRYLGPRLGQMSVQEA